MSKSFFIKNKACFGSYPTQEQVESMEKDGFVFFINLTSDYERKIVPYETTKDYIQFPVKDRGIPDNLEFFAKIILIIEDRIKNLAEDEKIYIHCKGGHGRSGVMVSIILSHMFGLPPKLAMEYTTTYHNRREMKEKWKRIGSPQTFKQKNFVQFFCRDILVSENTKYRGFLNTYHCPFYVPAIGNFNTVEEAIYAMKPKKGKFKEVLFDLLSLKFSQTPELYELLLDTNLGKIYCYLGEDYYLGCGDSRKEQNVLGKTLEKLRAFYLDLLQ
jgi:protein-tyrosine phosphatase